MQKLKSYIISLSLFFIPLFFLPITHEFYNINKFMLITISSMFLLSLSSYQFLKTRQLRWSKKSLRLVVPLFIFLVAVLLSTIVASTNKFQAIQNYAYGPLLLGVLTIFYWYVSQEEAGSVLDLMMQFSGFCVSAITLVLSLHPFALVSLPKTFQFLKNPGFSPVGTQTDLMLFLGFISIYQLLYCLKKRRQTRKIDWFAFLGVALSTLALSVTFLSSIYSHNYGNKQTVAPLNLSMKAAAESLSTPIGLIFGSGINNFSSVFTHVKDSTYNASSNWAVNSYDNAYSAFLQVVTESGLLGTLSLIGVVVSGLILSRKKESLALLVYMTIAFLVAPASLMLFLLFYCSLGIIASESNKNHKLALHISDNKSMFLIGLINMSVLIALLLLFVFALTPAYRAEVAMRESVDAIANSNLEKLYKNQYRAVVLNPYIERYRVNFSQTNLFVANQMASRPKPDQTIVTSSVQQAINEAQSAISLNPNKATNWENLGIIYKNVLGVKGAEKWAIAAFQRAIILDPQNVSYRLELGGVFYSIKQYENAIKIFQESTLLKPDLPNAYYNLAYAHYQNQNTKEAIKIMDSLLNLLKKQSSPNYEKVLKERNDFASGVPKNQAPTVIQ